MTEEQQMLRDASERYLFATTTISTQRRDGFRAGNYMSQSHWDAMAEMGWMAMPFWRGGRRARGLALQECATVAEQFGALSRRRARARFRCDCRQRYCRIRG